MAPSRLRRSLVQLVLRNLGRFILRAEIADIPKKSHKHHNSGAGHAKQKGRNEDRGERVQGGVEHTTILPLLQARVLQHANAVGDGRLAP